MGGIVGGYHPRVKEEKIALGVLNPTGVESFYPCVCPPFLSAFVALRVWGCLQCPRAPGFVSKHPNKLQYLVCVLEEQKALYKVVV
ncbi:hypothetical protein HHE01_11480 [Helicobacter heilmannii]|uniref:Uncharacterized protein n=1 Tax=Helicobacter heilmannii TaxID=35817 RepID=A0A0K2Y847_HELHE|nr:hypothetical protein HHE01_11480 [Helicobacter heilmannii]